MELAVAGLPHQRNFDHRFFAVAAAVFVLIVFIGFAPTFYLKAFFPSPPIARAIIWVHGFLMTAWVCLFVTQVYFISSKRIKLHQKLGFFGVGLAAILVIVGFITAALAAKYGTASAPPDIPREVFMVVPFFDLVVFSGLFGAAVYYRKNSPNHKRLMLLTAVNFLGPAIARFPGGLTAAIGPLWFFGVPTLIALALLLLDTVRNRKINKAFLIGTLFMIVLMWLRLPFGQSALWRGFAQWLIS